MRLYVIPLLSEELMKAEREIKLHKGKLETMADGDKGQTSQYLRDTIDRWQIIRKEILEAINTLENANILS
jgi:hypothetical protein